MNKHSTSYIGLDRGSRSWAQAAQVRGHRDNGAVFSY
jgi:hypothetical protein